MTSRRSLLSAGLCTLFGSAGAKARAQNAPVQTFAYDVIVLGGGGAGLAAAVAAAQSKARVCLIEKLPVLGGDTLRSTGYFSCVEPRRQKLNGVVDSLDQHYRQTLQAGGHLGSEALVRKMVQQAPETIRWLEECGVAFQDNVYEIYGSGHRRCLKPVSPRGTGYVHALSQRALTLGVHIMLETEPEQFEFDENTRLRSIQAVSSKFGQIRLLARKGVVIATGGFGAAAELVARHAPQLAGLPTDNSPGTTGDALGWAQTYGFAVQGLSYVECVTGNPPDRKTHARLFIPADFVLINADGRRFIEEDALRSAVTEAVLRQPNQRCLTVFDSQGLERLDPISQKGLFQALVADEIHRADTLEALAASTGLPSRTFIEEIRDYNRIALLKNPPESSKCSRIGCTPLIKPPFWAYEVGLTVHYTPGGLVVDEDCRVVSTSGKPIPGLWAAGEVTGSVHGKNRLGGNGLTDALTFGRLAGTAAAKNTAIAPI